MRTSSLKISNYLHLDLGIKPKNTVSQSHSPFLLTLVPVFTFVYRRSPRDCPGFNNKSRGRGCIFVFMCRRGRRELIDSAVQPGSNP